MFKWLRAFCLIYRQDLSPNSSGCNPHWAAVWNKWELFQLLSWRWMGCLCSLFLCICPGLAERLMVPLPPKIPGLYPLPSISFSLYWNSIEIEGRGGEWEEGERKERWGEEGMSGCGSGERGWGGEWEGRRREREQGGRTDFPKDLVLLAVLTAFLLPLHVTRGVSWTFHCFVWLIGSWWRCSLHGWVTLVQRGVRLLNRTKGGWKVSTVNRAEHLQGWHLLLRQGPDSQLFLWDRPGLGVDCWSSGQVCPSLNCLWKWQCHLGGAA